MHCDLQLLQMLEKDIASQAARHIDIYSLTSVGGEMPVILAVRRQNLRR